MREYHSISCADTAEENRHEWWSTQDLKQTAFAQSQSNFANTTFEAVSVLEQPLLDMILICNIIPSLLHLLLGIGNTIFSLFILYYLPSLYLLLGIGNIIMSSFFSYCYERFETLNPEEIESESASILAELDLNNKTLEYEFLKLEAAECREARVNFNKVNKGRLSADKKAKKIYYLIK